MGIARAGARRRRSRRARRWRCSRSCCAGVALLFFDRLAAQHAGARRCSRCATARPRRASIGLNPVVVKTVGLRAVGAVHRRSPAALFAPLIGLRHAELVSVLAVDPVPARRHRRRRRLGARAGGRRRHHRRCCPSCCRSLAEYRLLFFGALLLRRAVARAGRRHRHAGAAAAARADRAPRRASGFDLAALLRRRRRARRSSSRGLGISFGGIRAATDVALRRAAPGQRHQR